MVKVALAMVALLNACTSNRRADSRQFRPRLPAV